jgi:MOSC domain-containing protein YiiM
MSGTVTAVSSSEYSFTKPDRDSIMLLAGLGVEGFNVAPGELGENITTSGIDLLGLPVGTLLRIGDEAIAEVSGLRNPCLQIDNFQDGLLKNVVGRDEAGNIVRKAGIMSVVQIGGVVRPDDMITVKLPDVPHRPLDRV